MLLGFKIKNFRSYNDLQHFSMIAGKTRNFNDHIYETNGLKILKFSSIYGANASGKSNLILAIDLGKNLVLSNISNIISNQYFRFNKDNLDRDSYFEYEIEKNGKLYSYGFEININKKIINSEWLIDMTSNKENVIFEKDNIHRTFKTDLKIKNKDDNTRFEICKKDMKNNNTNFFLAEMKRRITLLNEQNNSFLDFDNVFDFFVNDLQLILPKQNRDIQVNYLSTHKDELKKLMEKLGLDISDLVEYETSMDEIKEKLNGNYKIFSDQFNQALENFNRSNAEKFEAIVRIENCIYTITCEKDSDLIVKVIKIRHTNSDVLFDTYEESDGTLRILELLDILLSNNKVFVIDEIDRSLHPALTKKFIKCFLDMVKEKNTQLIITTHESRLLDFNLVRRDEIWFAEKNDDKSTSIYSLEQFKDDARFDRKIDKAYLDGRYGAIPTFYD